MKDVWAYSNINARIRALLSQLIGKDKWRNLVSSPDIKTLVMRLEGTRYFDWAKDSGPEQFPAVMDSKVTEDSLRLVKRLGIVMSGVPSQILSVMSEEFDVEQIKRGLLCWNKKIEFSIPGDSVITGRHKIPWDIFNQKNITIDEIVRQLIHTPYGKSLLPAVGVYKRTSTVFFLEAALETGFLKRLWSQVNSLAGDDKANVVKLLGLQMDMMNIKNLFRCKLFYEVAPDKLEYFVYPNGMFLNFDKCVDAYSSLDARELLKKLAFPPFGLLSNIVKMPDIKDASIFIDEVLIEILNSQIRRILGGYPFTFGVPLAYIILHRWELKYLRSLAWSLCLGNVEGFKENPLAR